VTSYPSSENGHIKKSLSLADIGKIAILVCRKKLSKKILIFEMGRVLMLGRVFANEKCTPNNL